MNSENYFYFSIGLGIAGNLLSVVVLSQKRLLQHNVYNWFLFYQAISDLVALVPTFLFVYCIFSSSSSTYAVDEIVDSPQQLEPHLKRLLLMIAWSLKFCDMFNIFFSYFQCRHYFKLITQSNNVPFNPHNQAVKSTFSALLIVFLSIFLYTWY